jgi:hypothetical protein
MQNVEIRRVERFIGLQRGGGRSRSLASVGLKHRLAERTCAGLDKL